MGNDLNIRFEILGADWGGRREERKQKGNRSVLKAIVLREGKRKVTEFVDFFQFGGADIKSLRAPMGNEEHLKKSKNCAHERCVAKYCKRQKLPYLGSLRQGAPRHKMVRSECAGKKRKKTLNWLISRGARNRIDGGERKTSKNFMVRRQYFWS